MDVVIDWESIPWNEPEGKGQPGLRDKVCVRGDQEVTLVEITDGYAAADDWCTEGHLFHVLEGESTLRFKDGRPPVRMRAGDTGIVLAGEAHGHRMDPAKGERILLVLFEQT